MRTAPAKISIQDGNKIPFLEGRPDRTESIHSDDVLNLRIALGLHLDVSDLYGDPHLFG